MFRASSVRLPRAFECLLARLLRPGTAISPHMLIYKGLACCALYVEA